MKIKDWLIGIAKYWAPLMIGWVAAIYVANRILFMLGTPHLYIQLVLWIISAGAIFMALIKAKPLNPPSPLKGYMNILIIILAFSFLFIGVGFLSHQGGSSERISNEVKYKGLRTYEIGKEMYLEKGCTRCHVIYNNGYDFGPDLSSVGVVKSEEYIRAKILRPDAWTVPGYEEKHGMMPAYFSKSMTDQEIDYLVKYLGGIEQGKKMMPEWNPMYLG